MQSELPFPPGSVAAGSVAAGSVAAGNVAAGNAELGEPARHLAPAAWYPAPVAEAARHLEAAGYPADLAALLARRGVATPEQAQRFLEPRAEHLHDPRGLAGIEGATLRLDRARQQGETVAIVGDYDVDGVTGTALLLAVLRAHAMNADAILPHRMREGYGFQELHVERARELGAALIVTVDCGTTSVAAIEHAHDVGIDVIVTDHHLPGADFPTRAWQINPLRPDCSYPFAHLSGAGLALKLGQAFARHTGRDVPLAPLLRMACLGTVADLVPLLGENRVIAALGLRAIEQSRSPGLRALIEVAGVRPPLRSDDIGFRLGPRLNASGRLDSAKTSLELLLCRDAERARELALELDGYNRERQAEELRVVEEARRVFLARGDLPGILVAWSSGWHRGVVGIAAGRLARELNRPALLLAEDAGVATGSGRSIAGVGLHGFLERWQAQYERFGGHDVAIGMSVRTELLPHLQAAWEEAAVWPAEVLERRYEYELELCSGDITPELYQRLRGLEPHGSENPAPLLRIGPLRLKLAPTVFGEHHLKARAVGPDGESVWLLGWRFADRRSELEGDFEVLAHLEWDAWVDRPLLSLVDVRPAS